MPWNMQYEMPYSDEIHYEIAAQQAKEVPMKKYEGR